MRTLSLITPGFIVIVAFAWAADPAESTKEDEALLEKAGLKTDGAALLEYFRKRTPDAAARQEMARLVKQLDSDDFGTRQAAARKLVELGPPALSFLRPATKGNSLEVTRRAEECIEQIERAGSLQVPAAAVRLLAARKPAGAGATLLAYAPFAADEAIEEEVFDALVIVGMRDGRPNPEVLAALTDEQPRRRAAAALVVGRSSAEAERAMVRGFLKDADANVRLQAARGLVAGRDKEAVPVLIAMLGDAPLPLAVQAEDVLGRIAGDKSPEISLGGTERKKCQDAWAAWWAANGATVDLGKIEQFRRPPRLPPIAPVPANKLADVIYVPTPQGVVDKALELAKVRKGDVVYDLGCGDGRVVTSAAKKYGAYGFGFEIDARLVQLSADNAKKAKVERLVTIKHADVFTLDLREATVIYLYLLPSLNVKLLPQFDKLRPGTRIISHDFDMQGVKPDNVIDVNAKDDNGNMRTHKLYFWTTPLKKGK